LDVRPGSAENRLNLGSNGVLPVAVLTTPDFDAGRVDVSDLSRLRLGDAAGTARVSPQRYAYADADGDGDLDLILFFSVRELRESGALTAATAAVTLTGLEVDGTAFVGTDAVEVVGGG
jgi:hypothetical protein